MPKPPRPRRWGREEFESEPFDRTPTSRPYAELQPAEEFSDRELTDEERRHVGAGAVPDEMGRNSRAVQFHQVSTCAGWQVHPTSAEFYDAIRAETPTGPAAGHCGAVGTRKRCGPRFSERGRRTRTRCGSS